MVEMRRVETRTSDLRPVELAAPPIGKLAPRQRAVAEMIARGLTNKEIARNLAIEVFTVKGHCKALCKKLGVNNRVKIAVKALEHRYGAQHG